MDSSAQITYEQWLSARAYSMHGQFDPGANYWNYLACTSIANQFWVPNAPVGICTSIGNGSSSGGGGVACPSAAATRPVAACSTLSSTRYWSGQQRRLVYQFSNGVYGFSDAATNGGTKWLRQNVLGDYANYNSTAYGAGQVGGVATSIITAFANPCGAAGMAVKTLNGFQALGNSLSLYDNVQNGNWWGAAFNGLGLLGNVSQLSRSCFAAGTPLLTPEGSKPIEQFKVGDLLLSAAEAIQPARFRPAPWRRSSNASAR